MSGFLVLFVFVGLLVLGVPLFAVLGIATVLCLSVFGTHQPVVIAQQMFKITEQPVIFAIPFFILAGAIMTHGGIARRLVDIARAVVGTIPGGLGVATVLACMFFAAISGSSPVTVVAVGSMMLPALLKEGYDERFSMGLVTSAGSLGILIPPSIPMIIFAVVAGVSVDKLFLAGVLPGILIGVLLMIYCVVAQRGVARPTVTNDENAGSWLGRVLSTLKEGIWALLLPVIILGGIYGGFYTATEASAVAVVYAFLVELVIHRELRLKDMPKVFVEATVTMGSLLVILSVATAFNWYLAVEKIPDELAEYLISIVHSKWMFLLLLNLLLLAAGCVMDIISAILIITPLMAPVAMKMGVDPIHLGVIFIVNLEIGYLTPPIGINLFVSSSVFEKPLPMVMRSVLPFLGILFVSLMIITYVPALSLAPVEAIHGDRSGGTLETPKSASPTTESSDKEIKPKGVGDWFKNAAPSGGAATTSPTATPAPSVDDWFKAGPKKGETQ